ncbi:MAG: hypothetical protein ABSG00_12470 [Terracidiphilus sp.]|jgi:hypothetical protein
MKGILILLLALAALSSSSPPTKQSSAGWQINVEVKSSLRIKLRIVSDGVPGGAIHTFRLQIIESSASEHPLVLLEIGDRHHA